MLPASERAQALASKKRQLVSLRAAMERFYENGGVIDYSREDRSARYASIGEMRRDELRLERQIRAMQSGVGPVRQVSVSC